MKKSGTHAEGTTMAGTPVKGIKEINPANPIRSYVGGGDLERYTPINMKLERVNYDPSVVEIIPTASDQDLSQTPPPNTFLIKSTPMGSA